MLGGCGSCRLNHPTRAARISGLLRAAEDMHALVGARSCDVQDFRVSLFSDRVGRAGAAGLSEPARAHHQPPRARRNDGHHRPDAGTTTLDIAGATCRGRESNRRGRCSRRRVRGQVGSGWIYAAAYVGRLLQHERRSLSEAAFRCAQGSAAGHAARRVAEYALGASFPAGEIGEGARRVVEDTSEGAQLRRRRYGGTDPDGDAEARHRTR